MHAVGPRRTSSTPQIYSRNLETEDKLKVATILLGWLKLMLVVKAEPTLVVSNHPSILGPAPQTSPQRDREAVATGTNAVRLEEAQKLWLGDLGVL